MYIIARVAGYFISAVRLRLPFWSVVGTTANAVDLSFHRRWMVDTLRLFAVSASNNDGCNRLRSGT